MLKKEPFAMKPPSQYTRPNFYWRGGDVFNEQEYLLEEHKKALKDYKEALKKQKRLEQEIQIATELLIERDGYNDALVQFLEGKFDESNKEQKLRTELQVLEDDINDKERTLSEVKGSQNVSFSDSLAKERAYYLIEIQRHQKTDNILLNGYDKQIQQLTACLVNAGYQENRILEFKLNHYKNLNGYLKNEVNKMKAIIDKTKPDAPDRGYEANTQRKMMNMNIDQKIMNYRLKLKKGTRIRKHKAYLDHLLSVISELNECMEFLEMSTDDMCDLDSLRDEIFPEVSVDDIQKEKEAREIKKIQRTTMKEQRSRQLVSDFLELEKELRKKDKLMRLRAEEKRREDAEKIKQESEKQRLSLLEMYRNEVSASEKKKKSNRPNTSLNPASNRREPPITKPITSKGIKRGSQTTTKTGKQKNNMDNTKSYGESGQSEPGGSSARKAGKLPRSPESEASFDDEEKPTEVTFNSTEVVRARNNKSSRKDESEGSFASYTNASPTSLPNKSGKEPGSSPRKNATDDFESSNQNTPDKGTSAKDSPISKKSPAGDDFGSSRKSAAEDDFESPRGSTARGSFDSAKKSTDKGKDDNEGFNDFESSAKGEKSNKGGNKSEDDFESDS